MHNRLCSKSLFVPCVLVAPVPHFTQLGLIITVAIFGVKHILLSFSISKNLRSVIMEVNVFLDVATSVEISAFVLRREVRDTWNNFYPPMLRSFPSPSVCDVLQPPITSALFRPNILIRILYRQIPASYVHLWRRYQASHPKKNRYFEVIN
jgi:hypothetical protein